MDKNKNKNSKNTSSTRTVIRPCITRKPTIRLNDDTPFPAGKYWIGDPQAIFDENELKEVFPELSSDTNDSRDLNIEWWERHDMTYKNFIFCCHYKESGDWFSVYHIHKGRIGGLLYHLTASSPVVICVPEKLANERLDLNDERNRKQGWVDFSKDWYAYCSEDKQHVFFGGYQIYSEVLLPGKVFGEG